MGHDITVTQLPSARETLVLTCTYPSTPPSALFPYWTQPGLLCQWWPKVAEIEPVMGGRYHLAWPGANWHLRGQYTSFDIGKQLVFTWVWDHEPDDMTTVAVAFLPLPIGGTQLMLTQGPYASSEAGQTRRQGHIDGWRHFLGALAALQQQSNPDRDWSLETNDDDIDGSSFDTETWRHSHG